MKTRAIRAVLYAIAAITIAVNAVNISHSLKSERARPVPTPSPTPAPVSLEASAQHIAAETIYTVILENGYLNLYDGGKTPKMSERFDAGLFPHEDIALLRAGISFDDLESAYAFAENFLE